MGSSVGFFVVVRGVNTDVTELHDLAEPLLFLTFVTQGLQSTVAERYKFTSYYPNSECKVQKFSMELLGL